jgi:hypothetical protein
LIGCIGRPFAWEEALLVMAILLQNFDFKLDDPQYNLKVKSALTVKPDELFIRSSLRVGITASGLQERLSGSSGTLSANHYSVSWLIIITTQAVQNPRFPPTISPNL